MAKKRKTPALEPPAIPGLDLSPEGRKQLREMYTALRDHFKKTKSAKSKKRRPEP